MEEREARRLLVEGEQVELLAEHAVIALARLLEQAQVLLERGLVEERGAVDAHQLLARGVGAPVRARDAGQLHVLEPAGVRHVRPAAQIHEVAVAVEGEPLAARADVVDELELELVVTAVDRAVAREDLVALGIAHLAAQEGRGLGGDARHLRLDAREVVRRELPLRHVDVVVEAVLDHRPDGQLGAREEPQDRVGHQVRGRVAQHLERLGILAW